VEEFENERPLDRARLRQSNSVERGLFGLSRRRHGGNRHGGPAARMGVMMVTRAVWSFVVVVGIPVRVPALSRSRVSQTGMMIVIRNGLREILPRRGAGREDRR
jgi:hypothetical protein